MIYCAKTASLCVLEVLVNSALLPADRVIIEAHISPRVPMEEVDIASLPPGWKSPVPTNSTKDIGTYWAKRMDTAVLSVPSAVVDRERNFPINPLHRDFHFINSIRPSRSTSIRG